MTPRTDPIPWARCEKCDQKLVAEEDGDAYCLNCDTCSRCGDVHYMEDRCQEASEAEAQLATLREAARKTVEAGTKYGAQGLFIRELRAALEECNVWKVDPE